jgi:isoleucyl-tRNA synthetase
VHLAPAQLGRADPFFLHKETGEAASAHRGTDGRGRQRVEKEGIEAWFKLDAAELLGDEAGQYDKISDTLDVWFDSGTTHSHRAARLAQRRPARSARRPTCTWKARTSIAAGSIPRC